MKTKVKVKRSESACGSRVALQCRIGNGGFAGTAYLPDGLFEEGAGAIRSDSVIAEAKSQFGVQILAFVASIYSH